MPQLVEDIRQRYNSANEYLDAHEADEDKAEQDICLSTILWTGAAVGFAAGIGAAAFLALLVRSRLP